MAISVRLRGNNTDSYVTGTDVTFYVKGNGPNLLPAGEVREFTGGDLRNRKGGRRRYSITCLSFSVEEASGSSATQDFGTLEALQEVLTLYRHLWIYEVSGSSRVNKNGDLFWPNHGLPVAVVLDGEPTSALDFAGNTNFEFDLLSRSLRFS